MRESALERAAADARRSEGGGADPGAGSARPCPVPGSDAPPTPDGRPRHFGLLTRRPILRPETVEERFWRFVAKGTDCWEWTGARDARGYGRIGVARWHGLLTAGTIATTHRVSWAIHNGPIPDGLCVLHRCDNPPCVRPDHLFLGTPADNARDMCEKGRHRSVCRVPPATERAVALLLREGFTRTEIYRLTRRPLTPTTIQRIARATTEGAR